MQRRPTLSAPRATVATNAKGKKTKGNNAFRASWDQFWQCKQKVCEVANRSVCLGDFNSTPGGGKSGQISRTADWLDPARVEEPLYPIQRLTIHCALCCSRCFRTFTAHAAQAIRQHRRIRHHGIALAEFALLQTRRFSAVRKQSISRSWNRVTKDLRTSPSRALGSKRPK